MDFEYYEAPDLQRRLDELDDQSNLILQTAAFSHRDLSDEDEQELREMDDEYKTIKKLLNKWKSEYGETIMNTKGTGRKTDPDSALRDEGNLKSPHIIQPSRKGTNDFKSFGDFAKSVHASGVPGKGIDPRLLLNAPTTTSVEGVGADGGFLVPPDYRTEILNAILGEFSVLGLTDSHVTPSNQFIMPADETPPWDTSTGIQATWKAEKELLGQSKLALKEKTVKLNKLTALVPVSDELMEDAPSLNAYLRKTVPLKFTSAINLALVQGTGVGEPQGILNCGSLVTVAKESGQGADTILYENITNMWSRMYGPLRSNAIWVINQDIEPQLFTLSWEGTSSSVPAYMPANGVAGSPYQTLMGRPVIPTQACETIGDVGDIIFCAWNQYLTALKSEGLRQETSIHLWFDYDVTAFRFILRLGGQCWWSAAIDPRDGSNTLGAFIGLAART